MRWYKKSVIIGIQVEKEASLKDLGLKRIGEYECKDYWYVN